MRIIEINGITPPWYTDGAAIYITRECDIAQRNVLIKHESAHIYLQHRRREKALENKLNQKIDNRLANIAMDMEIAIHIYTDEDEKVIKQPLWILNGGIVKADAPKGLLYREDIYTYLLENGTNKKSHDWEHNTLCWLIQKEDQNKNTELTEKEKEKLTKKAIKEVEKTIEEETEKRRKQKKTEEAQRKVAVKIKPTIGSEIDHLIGKAQREGSYRRASRRNNRKQNILKKGILNKIKKQKVIIYLDRSWSFDDSKTKTAEEKLKYLLLKYRGKVEWEVLYFSDDVGKQIRIGWWTNYNAVINDINYRKPLISIIITDDDRCDNNLRTEEKIIVIPVWAEKTNIAKIIGCKEIKI